MKDEAGRAPFGKLRAGRYFKKRTLCTFDGAGQYRRGEVFENGPFCRLLAGGYFEKRTLCTFGLSAANSGFYGTLKLWICQKCTLCTFACAFEKEAKPEGAERRMEPYGKG